MPTLSRRELLASLIFSQTCITTATATPSTEFHVFDGLLHHHKQSSRHLGLEPISAVANIWRPGKAQQVVDERGVIEALEKVPSNNALCFFDIECWPLLHVSTAIRNESIRKFMRVAEITRQYRPALKFGFYNVLPVHTYWPLITDQFLDEYTEWRTANTALKPLAEMVDVIFPSLYTYYADRTGWKKNAIALLNAAREFGKPVFPFLWFEYHDSNKQLRDRDIDAASWLEELQLCRSHADGVVLWGGYQRNWSENAAWWRVAKTELQLQRQLGTD